MSDYIYTNGELYNVDELMHANFKYIKRIPNGKGGWKYIYDVDLLKSNLKNVKNKVVTKARDVIGYDEKEAYEKAKSEAATVRKAYDAAKKEYDASTQKRYEKEAAVLDAYSNAKVRKNIFTKKSSYTNKSKKMVDKANKEFQDAKAKESESLKKMEDTNYGYYNTKEAVTKHKYENSILGKYEKNKAIAEKNREERAEKREARNAEAKAMWEKSDLKKEIDRIKFERKAEKAKNSVEAKLAERQRAEENREKSSEEINRELNKWYKEIERKNKKNARKTSRENQKRARKNN